MSDSSESKPGWTLADIAEYVGKSASAVSNWRTRFEDTFPKPISRDGVALVFSPLEIQKWLEVNKHLTKNTADLDHSLSFEIKQLEKNVWKSIDLVRGKIAPYEFFYFFTDALAHNFDLNVKKFEKSLWTTFVDAEERAAVQLHEAWFDPFTKGIVSKGKELTKIFHLIPSLTGFDKNGSEHLTSIPLSKMIAKIIDAKSGHLVIDPCVGLGSLLLEIANESTQRISLYGRDINSATTQTVRALFNFNQIQAKIEEGDSIRGNQLPIGDRVVAAPPLNQRFNLSQVERKDLRWDYADPGADGGDVAWAQIVLGSMSESGIGAMITSHAILFRSGRPETFRRRLVGRGHLEAVITLSGGLLYGTRIPTAILVFNKNSKQVVANEEVLLVDVSIKNSSKMRDPNDAPTEMPSAVADLVLAHRTGSQIKELKNQEFELRFVKVGREALVASEFNLLPNRYIKPDVDTQGIEDIKGKIAQVERRIDDLNRQLANRRSSSNERFTQ
jgi:type I restriction-modification system DNA methylase subunit